MCRITRTNAISYTISEDPRSAESISLSGKICRRTGGFGCWSEREEAWKEEGGVDGVLSPEDQPGNLDSRETVGTSGAWTRANVHSANKYNGPRDGRGSTAGSMSI